MNGWAPLLFAGAGLLACHSAPAQSDDPPEKLDEIIVTGERAGPGGYAIDSP